MKMESINAALEYSENGFSAWAEDYPGAYSRGETREEALAKLPVEVSRYLVWAQGSSTPEVEHLPVKLVLERKCELEINEADTGILLPTEKLPLSVSEYIRLKELCLRSARDFMTLYKSVPQPDRGLVKSRRCFYGKIPTSAREMLEHSNEVMAYYAAGLGLDLKNCDDFVQNRVQLFKLIEASPRYLEPLIHTAEDGELWTLKKLLRRVIWHDRIHAKAMFRKAVSFWQRDRIANPFKFV